MTLTNTSLLLVRDILRFCLTYNYDEACCSFVTDKKVFIIAPQFFVKRSVLLVSSNPPFSTNSWDVNFKSTFSTLLCSNPCFSICTVKGKPYPTLFAVRERLQVEVSSSTHDAEFVNVFNRFSMARLNPNLTSVTKQQQLRLLLSLHFRRIVSEAKQLRSWRVQREFIPAFTNSCISSIDTGVSHEVFPPSLPRAPQPELLGFHGPLPGTQVRARPLEAPSVPIAGPVLLSAAAHEHSETAAPRCPTAPKRCRWSLGWTITAEPPRFWDPSGSPAPAVTERLECQPSCLWHYR